MKNIRTEEKKAKPPEAQKGAHAGFTDGKGEGHSR